MVKIVSAPEPFPLPGRPIRRLVASCLKALCMRGETKSLFDTIQAFLKLLAETKPPAKESSRMCVYARLMRLTILTKADVMLEPRCIASENSWGRLGRRCALPSVRYAPSPSPSARSCPKWPKFQRSPSSCIVRLVLVTADHCRREHVLTPP